MLNYYEVLGCERNATQEELKRCYRERAKKVHPDKGNAETESDFLLLHRAWKTLSDPDARVEYDRELDRGEFTDMPMYCEVDLGEMTAESDGSAYTYQCRCGGMYILPKEDIRDAREMRIGCDDCTFYIKIKVSS